MKLKTLFLVGAMLAFPMSASSQTAPDTKDAELSQTLPQSALVEIMTAPLDITELPENQPVELDLSLLNIPGGTQELAQGVIAKGYGRSVNVEDKTIGQVVLTSLAKGEKIEALNSALFTAQFDMPENKLNPSQPVKIMGNGPELIEALKRLQTAEVAVEETPKEESGPSGNPEANSSGEGGNPEAAAYQSPEPVEIKPEPVEYTETTEQGCTIRVDTKQEVALVQSKVRTYKDGQLTNETECSDTATRFPLKKSYSACTELVDLANKKAISQFQRYYEDQGGTRNDVGECVADPEKTFPIVEKFGSCGPTYDYAQGRTLFNATLVYTNNNNQEISVRGCDVSEDKQAVPLVQSVQGCTLRHDFAANKSFRQAKWTYTDNGSQVTVGSCEDDGTEYAHEEIVKDETGNYVCQPIAGNDKGSFTLQSRIQISVDGEKQFISECASANQTLLVQSSFEGCTIREDFSQMVAIRQAKEQTFENGVMIKETACEDSEIRFPIERSYSKCEDLVRLEDKTAIDQFKHFYVDQAGENQDIGDCQQDLEKTYDIVEKHDSCMISMDYTEGDEKAVFQSKLIYLDQNNKEIQVQGCQASETKQAAPLVKNYQVCSLRHDYSPGVEKSFRQFLWTYEDNGTVFQVGTCQDDGTSFDHVKTYRDDAGEYLCAPINNGTSVTLQSRKKITIDGLSQFVSECTPDTSDQTVRATTEGCRNPDNWHHDLSSGQSFGQERFYFDHQGKRTYLGDCQNSETTYTQYIETTSWEPHDDQLFAYPRTTVYITTPSGRYNIKTNEVLDGAQQMPYEFIKFDVEPDGAPQYEGCSKTQPYAKVKLWKRPDGTSYSEPAGVASPTTSNACVTTGGQAPEEYSVASSTQTYSNATKNGKCVSYSSSGSCQGYETLYQKTAYRHCTYVSDVETLREDGTVMTAYTISETWQNATQASSNWVGYIPSATAPDCPAHPTSTKVSEWRAKYGL